MNRQGILLIAHDQLLQVRLLQAFAKLGLPTPAQADSGDAAIQWLEHHTCAVCLLDYDLPETDGLRILARLHQRDPDLPVIMISGAGSESVAVAAFRAGVRDYIPKQTGFAGTVASQLRYLLQSESTGPPATPIAVGPEIPDRLRLPTYQNRMRVVGRELDLSEFRSVSIWEVGGGFLARGIRPGRRTPEALEFLDRDFPQLVAVTARGDGERRLTRAELLPTGYEDLFRAIGRRLDEQLAEAVTLSELSQTIIVTGLTKVDGSAHVTPQPFEWVLGAEETAAVLDEAYRQRGPSQGPEPGLLRRLARH
ncbi:MAG: response regulator [Thermomicrobiales bacterium]